MGWFNAPSKVLLHNNLPEPSPPFNLKVLELKTEAISPRAR